jgi:hypothetical protein
MVIGGNMTPHWRTVSRIALEALKRLSITLQLFALLVSGVLPAFADGMPAPGLLEKAVDSESGISSDRTSHGGSDPGIVDTPTELKSLEPKIDTRVDLGKPQPGRLYPVLSGGRLASPLFQPSISPASFDSLRGLSRIVPVQLTVNFDSKSATAGQPVQAVLMEDFRLGEFKVAAAGSILNGQITGATPARTLANASQDATRRFRSRGCVSLQFDEIVDTEGNRIPVTGTLVKQITVQSDAKRYEARVDKYGRIVKSERSLTPERQRAYNVVRAATMVPIPIPGNFIMVNFVAVPAALGAGGAADPSFAFNKPVDEEVKNRRLKGFAYAFYSNLPGVFWIQAFTEKGQQVALRSGDQLSVNLQVGSNKPGGSKMTTKEDLAAEPSRPAIILPEGGGTRLVPTNDTPGRLTPTANLPTGTKKVQAIVLKGSPPPGN